MDARTSKAIAKSIKKYQSLSKKKKSEHLAKVEKKIVYRSTKTERPEFTKAMLKKVYEEK